jgi:pimeloyl-ACP methyl ester carboxylesterase
VRVLRPEEMFPAGSASISARYITTASGLRIRVAESGNPRGEPILLLHGWACSFYAFRFLFEPLAQRGYHVIAVDLKGHGLSDKPVGRNEYTLDSMTSHALEVIEALQLRRVAIMGHSMGGRIGCEVALREPSLVERLHLINPVGFAAMPHISYALPIANSFAAGVFPSPFPSWLVRFPVSAVYGRLGAPTARDVEEYRAPTQFREFITASMHLLRVFDWKTMASANLAPLKSRTRVVVGALDRVVRTARSGRARRLVQEGWDLRVVPDVAHVVHEEAPGAVVDLVTGQ